MAEAGRNREIELLESYVANQHRIRPYIDEVVSQILEDPNISKTRRDILKAALGVAKLEGVILGMKHDDGQEVEVNGEKFQVLLAQGKMAESIPETASRRRMSI